MFTIIFLPNNYIVIDYDIGGKLKILFEKKLESL